MPMSARSATMQAGAGLYGLLYGSTPVIWPTMGDGYEPASDFLRAVIAEEVPLSGEPFAEANLRYLMEMTRDPNRANRDWATMLLSQVEADTLEIRAALIAAAEDEDDAVRAEALLGLAQRDARLALPFALKALSGHRVGMPVFEAVILIADPVLVDSLLPWTEPSGDTLLDELAREALAACEGPTRSRDVTGRVS